MAGCLAGVAGLSAYLLLGETLAAEAAPANQDTPVFMAHGRRDDVVAPGRGEEARDRLVAAGYGVDWHEYTMGHQVCPEEISDIARWLNGVFDAGS